MGWSDEVIRMHDHTPFLQWQGASPGWSAARAACPWTNSPLKNALPDNEFATREETTPWALLPLLTPGAYTGDNFLLLSSISTVERTLITAGTRHTIWEQGSQAGSAAAVALSASVHKSSTLNKKTDLPKFFFFPKTSGSCFNDF